jgi:ATP-dependent RNA helicase HelY
MWREVPLAPMVRDLEKDNLLPAIVFRTSRAQCDRDIEAAGRNNQLRVSESTRRRLLEEIVEIAKRYEMDTALLNSHPHYQALISSSIGAHHAGQLLMWRLLLEELMAAGLLRILVATGTVAAGVDFPARTVVITAHSRRGSEGYHELTAAEFQQMSGRAGRRGKDIVGFCLVAPSAFCDARIIAPLSKKSAEPLRSAYFPSASTVLNLLRYRNVDDLRYTVSRSLASYDDAESASELSRQAEIMLKQLDPKRVQLIEQSLDDETQIQHLTKDERRARKTARRLRRQGDELKGRQVMLLETALKGLRLLGYVENESLSPKGFWAANLCTNLVLELAETIESGLLDAPRSERLIAIVAALSADSYRPYLPSRETLLDEDEILKLTAIVDSVRALGMPGNSDERSVVVDAAYTAVTWYRTDDWQSFRSLLLLQGAAEGDAARLITQTAEHLNQLARLRDTHPDLAIKAEAVRNRLLRPPLTELE